MVGEAGLVGEAFGVVGVGEGAFSVVVDSEVVG